VGQTWAGRVGCYYLERCGLDEWITRNSADYIQKAISYASASRETIDAIKTKIYEAYWNGPLVDVPKAAELFTRLCLAVYDRKAMGLPCIHLRQDDSGELHQATFD